MKVVLISQQGSGTNLLRAFLNSHPNIFMFNELFRTGKKDNYEVYNGGSVKEFLDRKFNEREEQVVGFDLKYNQITDAIKEYIYDNEIIVIHLLRDSARTFLLNLDTKGIRRFQYNDIKQYSEKVKENMRKVIDDYSPEVPYFEYTYEEMTLGKQIDKLPPLFEQQLLNNLEVKQHHLFLNTEGVHKDLVIRF